MYLKMIALDFNGHNNGNSLMAVDLRKCNQILEHLWKMLRKSFCLFFLVSFFLWIQVSFCISNNYGTKNKKILFIRIRIHMKMGTRDKSLFPKLHHNY
jgi:hypothetical protein